MSFTHEDGGNPDKIKASARNARTTTLKEKMMRKALTVSFVALATTAFAASNTFKVNLFQDAVIEGKTFKAGEYKISVENGKAVLKQGKESVEVPGREESVPNKIDNTRLKYLDGVHLTEILVGGTHTKIVFDDNTPTHSGM